MPKRAMSALLEPARSAAMAALGPLERGFVARAGEAEFGPPCFIVGPPRSGTTLAYELLVTRFRFAYFSNLAHRLFLTPVSATRLGLPLVRSWQGSFKSRYGHVAGWGAPSEGGRIWNRWTPETHLLTEADSTGRDVRDIRATLTALSSVMGAPFVNKNVMHSVHMRLLDHVFPGCLFLVAIRDPVSNIRSILRAREAGEGPSDATEPWWSVRPRGWEQYVGADVVEQAAAQVLNLHRDMAEAAQRIGSERAIAISYRRLCEEPREVVDEIGAKLRSVGIAVVERGPVPAHFAESPGRPYCEEMESRIREAADRVGGRLTATYEPC